MDLVVIRGGGDIASGVAYRLFMAGFKPMILEVENPSVIRRAVSFGEAIYDSKVNIEGIKGIHAKDTKDIYKILNYGHIPIYIDPDGDIIKKLKPLAVVDAILAKENLGTDKDMASITIAIGPGFVAGKDVDLVVESKRGHFLGKVIHKGEAAKNTGTPGKIAGYSGQRVVRSPCEGIVKPLYDIGDNIEKGKVLCKVEGKKVLAPINGILRGIIKEGSKVYKGQKIGDIDPRGIKEYAFTISDKARAIGGGVLEGILYLRKELNI